MPNTKSAERRMRNSRRRHLQNLGSKSQLKSLEKRFLGAVASGKREDATTALRTLTSALDKVAKRGIIHPNRATRKKSRLSARLAALPA